MDNKEEIIDILCKYAELWNWQTKGMAPKVYAEYAICLADIPANVIDIALRKLSRSTKYWPAVAEIWQTSEEIVHEAQGVYEASGNEAWAEVQQQVKQAWLNKAPVFSAPEIALAAKRYGWHELCTLQSSEVGIARAQFCRFYSEIMTKKKQKKEMDCLLASATPAQRAQLSAIAQLAEKATHSA